MANKVYDIITERIIEQLENGVIPWEKPWQVAGQPPANGLTGRTYSGVNILLLACMPYDNPFWVTYKQAKKLDGNVKKGEKSVPVVFWKINQYDRETGDKLPREKAKKWKRDPDKKHRVKTVPILRYYNVFNLNQCENINPDKVQSMPEVDTFEWDSLEVAENIVSNYSDSPPIKHGGNKAYYLPAKDYVNMPNKERFPAPENYYKVLFHELAHSTGHPKRLDRKNGEIKAHDFGSQEYGKEELIAEITASFLSGEAGIFESTIENTAAYIENWLKVFRDKDNKTMVVHAAANAQKAADYILGRK